MEDLDRLPPFPRGSLLLWSFAEKPSPDAKEEAV
jgi:hypothetical protein